MKLHNDLYIHKTRHGVTLVKQTTGLALSEVMNLPISMYFMNAESKGEFCNVVCAEMNSLAATDDIVGKNAFYFWKNECAYKHIADDQHVMQQGSLFVTGETAVSLRKNALELLTFKMPWQQKNKTIGVMGITLQIEQQNMHQFSQQLELLLKLGLINHSGFNQLISSTTNSLNTYFTAREISILKYLIRGHTAKSISILLYLSRRTVENHIQRMKDKTGCKSKAELIDRYFDKTMQANTDDESH